MSEKRQSQKAPGNRCAQQEINQTRWADPQACSSDEFSITAAEQPKRKKNNRDHEEANAEANMHHKISQGHAARPSEEKK